MENINNLLKTIFLLILAISGNFIAETLGCKTQKLLSENIYSKHIVILLLLYFAMDITSNKTTPISPFVQMRYALVIWVLFIIFTRMNLNFTIAVFIILGIIYNVFFYRIYIDPEKI